MARPREFDETQVIQSALDVFWTKGYRATSVQDLVDATGLQRGSLYGAFGDKHGVFLEALDVYMAFALDRVRGLVANTDDPVDALRTFIRMGGQDAIDGPAAGRGCMVGSTCSELVAEDAIAAERVATFMATMRDLMADALRRGQALGSFDAERDADAAALFIQCGMQGLSLLAKTRPDPALVHGLVGELLRTLD